MQRFIYTYTLLIFTLFLPPLFSLAQESCTNSGCITYEGKQYCELESKLLYLNSVGTCVDVDRDGIPGCTLEGGYCVGSCSVPGGMICEQPLYFLGETAPDCNDSDKTINDIGDFKITAALEENYIKDTLARRKFDPGKESSITPFDDVMIKISRPCGIYQSEVSAKIEIRSGSETVHITDVKLPIGSDGKFSYILKGFPFGWVPTSVGGIGKITDQMLKGFPVEIFVHLYFNVNGVQLTKSGKAQLIAPGQSQCVRLYGIGSHKVISLLGKTMSSSNIYRLPTIGIYFAQFMSSRFDPFKKYQNSFSHFIDIKTIEDSNMSVGSDGFFDSSSGPYVKNNSSCGKGGSQYFFYTTRSIKNPHTFINSNVSFHYALPETSDNGADYEVLIHEMAHSFGGLVDEYLYTSQHVENSSQAILRNEISGRNCAYPTESPVVLTNLFKYNDKSYANPEIGCAVSDLYRSSANSVMNSVSRSITDEKFNVVSCGYIISAIKGGNPKSYWEECRGLDTIPITQ